MTGSGFVTVELFLASSDRSHHADELAYWSSAVGDLAATADARAVVHDSTALGGLAHGDETASAPMFVALLQIRQLPNGPIPQTLDALVAQLNQWTWVDRERSTGGGRSGACRRSGGAAAVARHGTSSTG